MGIMCLCENLAAQRILVGLASFLHICYGLFEFFHRADKAVNPISGGDFVHYETSANLIAGAFGLFGAAFQVPEALGGLFAGQIVAFVDYVWAIVIIQNCDLSNTNPEGPCIPYEEGWDPHAIVLYVLGLLAIAVSMGLCLLTLRTMRRAIADGEAGGTLNSKTQGETIGNRT